MSSQPQVPYKLVALDVDGTVVCRSQRVPAGLKAALAQLAGMSVRTVLCTGRRWRTTVAVLDEMEHAHPLAICTGGALIKQAEGERTLHAIPMSHALARRTVDAFRDCGLMPILLHDRRVSERDLLVAERDRERAQQVPYTVSNAAQIEYYSGDYPEHDEPPLTVYALDESDRLDEAAPVLRQALGDAARVEVLRYVRYGSPQKALEVHDPRATKWAGLEWLLGEWGISAEDVLAVGDDVNDIPMLQAVGLSFAMPHAGDEVKAAADAIAVGDCEDAVAGVLQTVFGL